MMIIVIIINDIYNCYNNFATFIINTCVLSPFIVSVIMSPTSPINCSPPQPHANDNSEHPPKVSTTENLLLSMSSQSLPQG